MDSEVTEGKIKICLTPVRIVSPPAVIFLGSLLPFTAFTGVRQRIEQKKVYPRRAKRMRKQGIVKVAFTISKNGTISRLRIIQSSGIKSLDAGALQAVKKVGRFPAIPAGIRKQSISYIIPISYRLR